MSLRTEGDLGMLEGALSAMPPAIATLHPDVAIETVRLEPAGAARAAGVQESRLQIECPQKPGIILALTRLMTDAGCALSHLDTNTTMREGVVYFHLECTVSVPGDAEELEQGLRLWAEGLSSTKMVFDKTSQNVSPLEHA